MQTWKFADEPVIRIGRASDNNVILYSSVVSRHHAELRQNSHGWQVVSLGTNGTYLNEKRIDAADIVDGSIIRIASSGPKLQVRITNDQIESLRESASENQFCEERPTFFAPDLLNK
jgi:pSer/pThr/pTyr-binding forkhead associated (FHA) protein